MNRLHSVRWLVVVMGLSFAIAGTYAQAPQSGEFQPQVGQAGKDVVWVPTQQDLVDRMLDMAKVTPQDYVIDLDRETDAPLLLRRNAAPELSALNIIPTWSSFQFAMPRKKG